MSGDGLIDPYLDGRFEVDAALWTQPWQGKLAPLGVTSVDQRRLGADGVWSVPAGGACLYVDGAEPWMRQPIGRVDWVSCIEGELIAGGVLDPGFPTEGLLPELALDPQAVADARYIGDVLEFGGGEIRGVRLGTSPAFPDLWFRLVAP